MGIPMKYPHEKMQFFFLRLSLVDTTYGVYYDWGLGGGPAFLQEGADGVYHPGKV